MADENSAGAVVFRREGKKALFLILHYEEGHWDFVKGKIEKGEEEKDTVIREAEEETGIKDLRFIPGFKEKVSYSYKRKGKTISKEAVFYLAESRTKEVRVSFEHKGFKWLEYDDAPRKITYDNSKNVLKKADKFLKEKVLQSTIKEFG